jgi:hypothetical protein
MFARIARIAVLGVALTLLGGNGMAAATSLTAQPTQVVHTAGDGHCC